MTTTDSPFVHQYNPQHPEENYNDKFDVFVSYRRSAITFVNSLVAELACHDIRVWLDIHELPQTVSKEYTKRIHKAIDNSQLVLFIYTKDAEDSKFIIEEEIGYASKKGRPICCYAHDAVDFDSMKEELREIVKKVQWHTSKENAVHIAEYQDALKGENRRLQLAEMINDIGTISSKYTDINLFLIRIEIQRLLGHPTPYGSFTNLANADPVYSNKNNDLKIVVKPQALFIPIPEDKRNSLKESQFISSVDHTEHIFLTFHVLDKSVFLITKVVYLARHANTS